MSYLLEFIEKAQVFFVIFFKHVVLRLHWMAYL